MKPTIQLEDVSCLFGPSDRQVRALDDVSLAVMPASYVAVMGSTGSGKSSLLNCASGLERATAGRVHLLEHDITSMGERRLSGLRRDQIGFVFQSYNLFAELTVGQNVLMPCRLGARRARTVIEVLQAVGMSGYEARKVGELSGGERQRVAIARALVTAPSVLFADEPTGALDPTTGAQILTLLRRAVDEQGCTVLMVTHDPTAAAISDRLVLLRAGSLVDDRPTPDAGDIAQLMHHVAVSPVGAAR